MIHLNIKLNDLQAQWDCIEAKALPEIIDYLRSGIYVGSKYVTRFEDAWSDYIDLN